MGVVLDASGAPVPVTTDQWRAGALLSWLMDKRIAAVILNRGLGTFASLVSFCGKLQDATVEWEDYSRRTMKKVDGHPVPRLLSHSEIDLVKGEMLRLLTDPVVRRAIARYATDHEHKRRADEYMKDETGLVSPPPKWKALSHEVRLQLQSWREDLEREAASRSLVVRPW